MMSSGTIAMIHQHKQHDKARHYLPFVERALASKGGLRPGVPSLAEGSSVLDLLAVLL